MTEPNDGGSAFPLPAVADYHPAELGMSLRDWFAGQALAGLMVGSIDKDGWPNIDDAITAYKVADWMLQARGGGA